MDINGMKINKVAAANLKPIQEEKKNTIDKVNTSSPKKLEVRVDDAKILNEAADELKNIADVDMEKVKQVKQAIANGELNIDFSTLAQSIMDDHLLGTKIND